MKIAQKCDFAHISFSEYDLYLDADKIASS